MDVLKRSGLVAGMDGEVASANWCSATPISVRLLAITNEPGSGITFEMIFTVVSLIGS